jgi:hypothetical protein
VFTDDPQSLLGNPESGGKTRSAKDSVGNIAGDKVYPPLLSSRKVAMPTNHAPVKQNSKQDTDDDKATSVADNGDDMAFAVADIVSQQLAKRPVPIKNQEVCCISNPHCEECLLIHQTLLGKPQSGSRARSGTVSAANVAGGPVARGKVSDADKDEVTDSPENVVQKADKQLADESTLPAKATIKNQEVGCILKWSVEASAY